MAKIPAYLSRKIAVNDGTGIGYSWVDGATSEFAVYFNKNLADECNILRRTKTADGQGGFTVTWAESETNVPCQIEWGNFSKNFPTPKDELVGGKVQTSQLFVCMMALNHDVRIDDRIYGVHSGYTFEVIDTNGAETFSFLIYVLMRKLGPQ